MSTPTLNPLQEAEAQELPDEQVEADRPWVTVVWNDPINLMSYVTHVLMKVFGYPKATATTLMLDVHNKGKAIVSSGPRERMEGDAATLHGYGLWATVQRDS
jgi:ATP-dependent Clp protease adaptor protein ClpS